MIAAEDSVVEGEISVILQGRLNRTSNRWDTVIAGQENHADGNGYGALVVGGFKNWAQTGSIFAGVYNTTVKDINEVPGCVDIDNPHIFGGSGNTSSASRANLFGGYDQTMTCGLDNYTTVVGTGY